MSAGHFWQHLYVRAFPTFVASSLLGGSADGGADGEEGSKEKKARKGVSG